jgi:hypothetical protein
MPMHSVPDFPIIALKSGESPQRGTIREALRRVAALAESDDLTVIPLMRGEHARSAWLTVGHGIAEEPYAMLLAEDASARLLTLRGALEGRSLQPEVNAIDTLDGVADLLEDVLAVIRRQVHRLPLRLLHVPVDRLRLLLYHDAVLALPRVLARAPRPLGQLTKVAAGAAHLTAASLDTLPSGSRTWDVVEPALVAIDLLEQGSVDDATPLAAAHLHQALIDAGDDARARLGTALDRLRGVVDRTEEARRRTMGSDVYRSGSAGHEADAEIIDLDARRTWAEPVRVLRTTRARWLVASDRAIAPFVGLFARGLLMTDSAS